MNPLFAAALAALPTLVDLVRKVWLAIPGSSKEDEEASWQALSSILPAPWSKAFEPFFRAVWEHFDILEKGWEWLESYLRRGGVEEANVLPWDGIVLESHMMASAWLDDHFASIEPAPETAREAFDPAEAPTRVEK